MMWSRPTAVATGGGDGKVRVWTDEGRAGFPGMEKESFVSHSAASKRNRGGSGGRSGRRGSGSAPTSIASERRGTGHEGAVLSVCWHPGGEFLASAGQDWAIWLWNADGRALSYIHAHRRWTRSLSFSSSGEFLASHGGSGCAGWNVAVSEQKQVFTVRWKHPRRLIATQAEVRGSGPVVVGRAVFFFGGGQWGWGGGRGFGFCCDFELVLL